MLRQTYSVWELVICDDGSSDNSCDVIQRYAGSDKRLVLIRQVNRGQASAINSAFAASHGDVVCILDADDLFAPSKLEKVVRAFRSNPTAGIVTHDLILMDSDGRVTGTNRYQQQGYVGPEIPTLRLGLPMPQASGLSFRRQVLGEILPVSEQHFRTNADGAIAYTAAYLTLTSRVPEALAFYRIHATSTSGTTSTAHELNEKLVAGILEGMDRVVAFTDQYMQERFAVSVPTSRVRNILEHRLMLGILRDDRRLVRSSANDLSVAYKHVRRDYPASHYLFWKLLAVLPTTMAQRVLHLAFWAFRIRRALTMRHGVTQVLEGPVA
jgi:glycosyltransferase involved in cell wall biosynthesis